MKELLREFGKAGLYGLTALALVALTLLFGSMDRQNLVILLAFLLLAVLAGYVWYLAGRVRGLERQVEQLAAKLGETPPKD